MDKFNALSMEKRQIQEVDWFWEVCLVFIVTGAVLIAVVPKGDVVLKINTLANSTLDRFFINFTGLGSGLVFIPLIIGLLFKRFYYALAAVLSIFFTGIITGTLKHFCFNGTPRPTHFFNNEVFVHLIDSYNYFSYNSFPSGHAATAFALATLVVIVFNHKLLNILAFVFAFGISVSRIYLLQHFFIDVYFGAILGMASTLLSFTFISWGFYDKNRFQQHLTWHFDSKNLLRWTLFVTRQNLTKWMLTLKQQFVQFQIWLF